MVRWKALDIKAEIALIHIPVSNECDICEPNVTRLGEILESADNKDRQLILTLNYDWLGRPYWHLDKLEYRDRFPVSEIP